MRFLYDIRAEVWMAQQQQQPSETPAEVVVRAKGTFSRAYNPDVLRVETHEADALHPLTYLLSLSREGLYDTLPETLHHPPSAPLRAGRDEARAMLEQSKRLRQEETEGRLFWLPFEQETFRQRVRIEAQEAQALTQTYGPVWDELHRYLWGALPVKLSARQRACLLTIWINAHQTVGNWEQTAMYIARFLEVPVQIRYGARAGKTVGYDAAVSMPTPTLGNSRLGQDWVLSSDDLPDDGGLVRLQIGPLSPLQLHDYLPGGLGLKYIRLLADYLLPADADWQLVILPDPVSDGFRLSADGTTGRLGMTTTLSN